ncbi:hypothetical protein EVAR_53863_1 [Eumeta japonica]|uniref:Uncharacterized protein n=1 Tax=Eumeta variegata TaxID=151549 RepID=A0A4C1XIR6_EUMVA|nr:hypothetical protein EVAR_53863_1 [Eumeta japonica]
MYRLSTGAFAMPLNEIHANFRNAAEHEYGPVRPMRYHTLTAYRCEEAAFVVVFRLVSENSVDPLLILLPHSRDDYLLAGDFQARRKCY